MTNLTAKYLHTVGPRGPSPYFPDPTCTECDVRAHGWPPNTEKVEFDHEENCATVVLTTGASYTIDTDGYGCDVERGDFYVDATGVHYMATTTNKDTPQPTKTDQHFVEYQDYFEWVDTVEKLPVDRYAMRASLTHSWIASKATGAKVAEWDRTAHRGWIHTAHLENDHA